MRSTRGVVAALIAVAVTTAVRAQDAPAPTTEKRLEELEKQVQAQQRELDALKKAQRPEPSPGEKKLPDGTEQKAQDALFEWGYDDGFFVRTLIGGQPFTLRPEGRVQLDYRYYASGRARPKDEFLVRRARAGFQGTFSVFGFQFDVDPTRGQNGGLPIGDFWMQVQAIEELKLRFGHFRTPFGLDDGMLSDLYLDTVERPMAVGSGNVMAPDFRPGAMVFGKIEGGLFQYWLAVTNQPDSNTVTQFDPLFTARLEGGAKGVALGVSGIWDRRTGNTSRNLPGLTPGQFQFFAPTIELRGWVERYDIDACWYSGPFWARVEYDWCQQRREGMLVNKHDARPLVMQSVHGTVGWLFWGPSKDSKRPHVTPFEGWSFANFDAEKRKNARNVGVELVASGEWMETDDGRGKSLPGVSNAPSIAQKASNVDGMQCWATTLGVNVHPMENVRFMLDWVHVHFSDSTRGERPGSHNADEILTRFQLEF